MGSELELVEELRKLRRGQRRFQIVMGLLLLVLAGGLIAEWRALRRMEGRDTFELRQLTIVDAEGKPRVILGSPLPAPLRFGKLGHRDGPVSGMLIVDPTGTERGGYVTGDGSYSNALLTLDGQGHQTVLLLAEPDGATLFRIWNGEHGSLTAGVQDAPFFNLKKAGELKFAAPEKNAESVDQRALFR
jgi:hypothetical protein